MSGYGNSRWLGQSNTRLTKNNFGRRPNFIFKLILYFERIVHMYFLHAYLIPRFIYLSTP